MIDSEDIRRLAAEIHKEDEALKLSEENSQKSDIPTAGMAKDGCSINDSLVADINEVYHNIRQEFAKLLNKYTPSEEIAAEDQELLLEAENAKLREELAEVRQMLEEKEAALREFKSGTPHTIAKPYKEFYVNGEECSAEEFEKSLRYYSGVINVTIFYLDNTTKEKIWTVGNFTEKSRLSSRMGFFLVGWREKGIIGIRLDLDKKYTLETDIIAGDAVDNKSDLATDNETKDMSPEERKTGLYYG